MWDFRIAQEMVLVWIASVSEIIMAGFGPHLSSVPTSNMCLLLIQKVHNALLLPFTTISHQCGLKNCFFIML